ncbi:YkgJ family cysteine cluster protein [Bordetella sp. FB-8]|uniref:YkgJ family cysteine cluster protein n=1 Tax=Bordetella sp. FB-8 TaxID=1159870 RepID=UPI00037AF8A4|nr:YkgJ family cysteine cluster protein [Bordetella sp. FB-8]
MQEPVLTIAQIEKIFAANREQSDAKVAQSASILPEALRKAYEQALAYAPGQVEKVRQRLAEDRSTLSVLVKATQDENLPRETRMAWLRELTERLNQIAQPLSACMTSHCSHCCYTPVTITRVEAELIGKAIGVAPETPPSQVSPGRNETSAASTRPDMGHSYAWPCPFLAAEPSLPPGKGGKCAIYAHRPMVCRSCLSMAPSDKLCELQPDHLVPIPLFDARVPHLLAAQIGEMDVADIRDFFPKGLS